MPQLRWRAAAPAGARDVTTFVDGIRLTWGESLRWDDRADRLYFVDCATQRLHWLDGGEPPLHTVQLASLPTGMALTESGALLVCMDLGLHVVDPDAGTAELRATYPDGMHGRANDMTATHDGGVVTGTLNLGPGPGALWRWHPADGWSPIDDDNGNVNGPVPFADGTVVVADSVAGTVYRYPPGGGARTTIFDHRSIGGSPDGACADADGGVWSCSLARGALVRLHGDDGPRIVDVPVRHPSDITFGAADLGRAFVVSIALDFGLGPPNDDDGKLLVLDDLGVRGVPEPRVAV